MKNLIIFGISKIAEVVYDYIKDDKRYNIVGFCVDSKYLNEDRKFGLPVESFENIENIFSPEENEILIAIGYHKMNKARADKCAGAIKKGYKLATYVNSHATVASSTKIGYNCIILDNVAIEPHVTIGNNVCVYCNATIAHHSTIGDNTWVTSGTVVGGNSSVGKNSFLGINSTVGHNITLGEENFIGAGAIVTKNSDDKSVFIAPDTPKYRLDTDQFIKFSKFD